MQQPGERIEHDPATTDFGLWPVTTHQVIGEMPADGVPVHLSETDWEIRNGAPCLGQHTRQVLTEVLGKDDAEIDALYAEGVL